MRCPRCEEDNPARAKFCMGCGAPLTRPNEIRRQAARYEDLERTLTEALEQQTASSELLRIISESRNDVQPVFEAIAESAARLCRAQGLIVFQVQSEMIEPVAAAGANPEAFAFYRSRGPLPVSAEALGAQAVRERKIIHVPQALEDPDLPQSYRDLSRRFGTRAFLIVPIARDASAQGVILAGRREAVPFSRSEIRLLKTFADQAAIAIENVRLFAELQEKNHALTRAHAQVTESLAQQTATSEILRRTSESLTDAQPTFDAIAVNATRLCDAVNGFVFRYDGELIHVAAYHNVGGDELDAIRRVFPIAPGRGSVTARAILTRAIAHVVDLSQDPEYAYTAIAQAGFRTVLAVPMLRDGIPIGAIVVTRMRVTPFSPGQVELLETFARQAVIAVETVRLFRELQTRTRDLGRSVEELKALGEVSRAVSSTLDLDTVLNVIVARAVELSSAQGGVIYEYDEANQTFTQVRASHHVDDELTELLRSAPIRLGEGVSGRAAVLRAPVQVTDARDERTYDVARVRDVFERHGYRSLLALPLLFEAQVLGVLTVWRREAGEFAPEVTSLLQTFASQCVLAIRNAHLFRELEDKSRQLEIASQHKSEFLANMSHELRTPLNAIIGFSEVLGERMFGELNEKQDEYLKDIYASGTHLLSLINDILDLSKIEAGRMELELTDFHLPTALDNALTLVRERAGRRSITLQMSVDERLGEVRADERKIRQVLLNLLSNAIKFTPEGGRIEVSAAPRDGSVEVSVSDTGVGIAPEDQEAVFEEFRQVGTADKKVEGTGLGLTLCRKFVQLHGGKIWVKSEVGVGSTFTFTIPMRHGE
jgi:two-component system, NtrC family, sensor kinase